MAAGAAVGGCFRFEERRFSETILPAGLAVAFAAFGRLTVVFGCASVARSGVDAPRSASDVSSITATSVLAVEPRSIVAAIAKDEKNRTSSIAMATRTRS